MEMKSVDEILYEQLELLSELSKGQMVEPEQNVEISLAMVEIAKAIHRQY